MKVFRIITITGALVVFAGAFWVIKGMDSDNKTELGDSNKGARPVLVSEVQPSVPLMHRIFPGLVQAVSQVELGFSVPGKLDVFNAKEGMAFSKGDVLAALDSRDYEYARNIAQANYEETSSAFKRKEVLFKQGVISDSDFELAKARLEISKGELDRRCKALEDTILRAPFNGVVAQTYVENYEHVGAAQPVLSFQDVSVVEVRIDVSEDIMALKNSGFLKNIKVRFKADRLNRCFGESRISEYKTQANSLTGTYEVLIQLKAPTDFVVLPGMTAFVEADIPVAFTMDASGDNPDLHLSRIPVEAIIRNAEGEDFVWVVRDAMLGRIERVLVNPLCIVGDYIESYSSLSPGDRVITSAVDQMQEDIKVCLIDDEDEGGLNL